MSKERRNERSSIPWQAAGIYLKQLARSSGMERLVLASQDGLLLTDSGDQNKDAQIAAFAPMAVRDPSVIRSRLGKQIFQDRPLQVWQVQIGHRACYLATTGQHAKLNENVGQTLQRIFQRFVPQQT